MKKDLKIFIMTVDLHRKILFFITLENVRLGLDSVNIHNI